jgi:hypothetical protein
MTAPALRPRTVTEILDAAFHVYRSHFTPLTLLAALVVFPIIVASLLLGIMTAALEGQGAADEPGALAAGAGMALFLSMPVILLWFVVAQAALQKGVSDAYLGAPVSWTGAVRHALSRFWSLLGASIVKGLAFLAPAMVAGIASALAMAAQAPALVVLIFLATFVAMFFLFVRLALVPATVVLEENGAGTAIRRSWELSADHGGRILGGILLAYLIMFALQLTVMGIVAVATNIEIAQVASNLGSIVTYPIVAGVVVLMYYDLRIRKEGFDLEVMSAELARLPDQTESVATRRIP